MVHATIQGLTQVQQRLDAIAQRCANPTPILQYGQTVLSRSLAQNFLQEGRPVQWARRVSDAHGNFKHADKATHPVLRLTGRLCNSTVSTNDGGESISRIRIRREESTLEQGTRVPYAIYHNSEKPRKQLARRLFLLFQAEDRSTITARARVFVWWGH